MTNHLQYILFRAVAGKAVAEALNIIPRDEKPIVLKTSDNTVPNIKMGFTDVEIDLANQARAYFKEGFVPHSQRPDVTP